MLAPLSGAEEGRSLWLPVEPPLDSFAPIEADEKGGPLPTTQTIPLLSAAKAATRRRLRREMELYGGEAYGRFIRGFLRD
jgi:hypothetical protein